jgi:hypothetical protein
MRAGENAPNGLTRRPEPDPEAYDRVMRSVYAYVLRAVVLLLAILSIAPVPAAAKSYTAERFDVRVLLMPGGTLEVSETVVFRFESGTFDHVFREIPARRTDGIQVVSASLDGRLVPRGGGVNEIEVTGDSKVRVRWRFHPLADSTHVFGLTYLVHGVVSQTSDADVMAWRALPAQHQYRIRSSTIDFEWPATIAGGRAFTPQIESHRVEGNTVAAVAGGHGAPERSVRVTAQQIGVNGWTQATFVFPRGSILANPPEWQQRQMYRQSLSLRWTTAAVLIALAGLIVLAGLRQHYDPPRGDLSTMPGSPALPDSLAPGLAGSLLANGRTTAEHALAALFSLADRGILAVEERPRRRIGQAEFDVRRAGSHTPLAAHERTLLAIALPDVQPGQAVPLNSVRRQLARGLRQFRAAVEQELMAAGLIDVERKRVRDRYVRVSVAFFVLATAAAAAAAPVVHRFGGWPLLVAAALAFLGIASRLFAAATTALSNEGVRRAARWRNFRGYLRSISRNREPSTAGALQPLLPYAMAVGLGAAWAKHLKRHPGGVPPWFKALSTGTQDSTFATFVASSAAAHGGAAGAGASAAGGGSSGAG